MNFSHVPLEQQPLGKSLITVPTFVRPLLLVCDENVFPQSGASVVRLAADSERLLSCVGPHVLRHVSFQFETLGADLTAVGSFSRVHSHVVLQMALTGAALATYVALKVSVALM